MISQIMVDVTRCHVYCGRMTKQQIIAALQDAIRTRTADLEGALVNFLAAQDAAEEADAIEHALTVLGEIDREPTDADWAEYGMFCDDEDQDDSDGSEVADTMHKDYMTRHM